jgi:glycosyltransferase involved in cell wall biosynthesis
VEFAGFVENVADYLATFDVFIYPSLREGLGSSLLDAMHFGLPIVASEVGGIPEIVEHKVNGLLIAPGSARELIAAIQRVVTDPGLRESMRRENRNKAARFGVARMATSYESIYRSILHDPH